MKIFSLLTLMTLVSCGSTALYTPQARMISPETPGDEGKVAVDFRATMYRRDRADFENNDIKNPLKKQGHKVAPSIFGEIGIEKWLSFYGDPNPIVNSPSIVGGKIQFLGDPANEAKKGNLSASVTGGFGYRSSNQYVGWKNWEGQTKRDDVESVRFRNQHHELGFIVGYRWQDKLLHYVSSYYFHQDINGDVKTEDAGLDHKKFDFTQDGTLYSTGIMYRIGEKHSLKGEYTHMISGYSFSHQQTTNTVHLALGINF